MASPAAPPSKPLPNLLPHLLASGAAAVVNFPLWRASAMAQSGFNKELSTLGLYSLAVRPPYHGLQAVVLGMTWARAGIFFGSDALKARQPGWPKLLPPLVSSTVVQVVNMPIIRASISLQSKDFTQSGPTTTLEALRHIYREEGVRGLYRGTSAGILKTVPK
jgi:hypothetical protein